MAVIAGGNAAVAVPTPWILTVSRTVGVAVVVLVSVNVLVAVGVLVEIIVDDKVNVTVDAANAFSVGVAHSMIDGVTDKTRSVRIPARRPTAAENGSQRGTGCRVSWGPGFPTGKCAR